ncbi:MAG TPA: hypothetical protein PLQ49_06700 [Methanothrix sp.]|nr:hypothetical protein [Methanothrix sp.]HRW82450.1 hypothetical protein [Methanothrix sp.]
MPFKITDESGKERTFRTNYPETNARDTRWVTACGQDDCSHLDCAIEASKRARKGYSVIRTGLSILLGISIFLYGIIAFINTTFEFKGTFCISMFGLLMVVIWIYRLRSAGREQSELVEIKNTGKLRARNAGHRGIAIKAVAFLLVVWFFWGFYIEVTEDRQTFTYYEEQARIREHPSLRSYFHTTLPDPMWYPGKSIIHSFCKSLGIIDRKTRF